MSRQLLFAHILEPELRSRGSIFLHFPLHITLVPWFILEGEDVSSLIEKVGETTRSLTSPLYPFLVHRKERALFGPANDIPVVMLTKTRGIESAHRKLLEIIRSSGSKPFNSQWTGENFSPHITIDREKETFSNSFLVSSISLIERVNRSRERGMRKVLYTFQLKY